MATIEGTGGNVSLITGFAGKVSAWAADIEVSTVETTGFADNGYRVFEPTGVMLRGTVTASGQYQQAGTSPLPDGALGATPTLSAYKGALTLQAKSGCTYGFDAVVTAIGMKRSFDSKLEITFAFRSAGQISQTWDLGEEAEED
jgi:hypothetical protein